MNNDTYQNKALKLDGQWEKFQGSELFSKKKELESKSYFVDEIVKEMIIDAPDGNKLAKILFALNRMQRSFFANHFHEFYEQQKRTDFDHRPYYYAKFNPKMVFLYFKDDYPDEHLKNRIDLYLTHMSYLYDYRIKEIGLIGKANGGSRYAFGYTSNQERPQESEIRRWEELFQKLNLKLRTDISQLELSDVELPTMNLFTSPF